MCRSFGIGRPKLRPTAGELWQEFNGKYLGIQSLCIPIKRVGGPAKRNPLWFTREIATGIYERQALYCAARVDPTPQSEVLLYSQSRLVKRMVRQAKASEESRVALACKDNPREFYGYVNLGSLQKGCIFLLLLMTKVNNNLQIDD